MPRLLLLVLSYLTLITSECGACVEPSPSVLKNVKETDGSGTVLFTISETTTTTPPLQHTWSFSVLSPAQHAAYLASYVEILQNATQPSEWRVILKRPLDLEKIYDDTNFILSDLSLNLECRDTNAQAPLTYPRTLIIHSVGEFGPDIADPLPIVNVSEDSAVGSVVASLSPFVTDQDIQNNGQQTDIARYFGNPYIGNILLDGNSSFQVSLTGDIILLKPVDFESGQLSFGVNFTVQDQGGLTSSSILEIHVVNCNDNPPFFVTTSARGVQQRVAEYRATVDPSFTGPVSSLIPGPIEVSDLDHDLINYYLVTGFPQDYQSFVSLDVAQGTVLITKPLGDSDAPHFTLVIEARDGSPSKQAGVSQNVHTATASLLLSIAGRNLNSSATPTSNSSSNIADVDSDALFISLIVISALLLVLIIIVVIIACKLRKQKRQHLIPQVERCHTLKDRKPSDWALQMRPIERTSEKEFMRSLSSGIPATNEGFRHESNDEVFVTGVAPFAGDSMRPFDQINHREHSISHAIVPFNGNPKVPGPTIVAQKPLNSTSTLPRLTVSRAPVQTKVASPSYESQRQKSVLETLESLDLLTSVQPIPADDGQPTKLGYVDNGTMRSLRPSEVLHDLEQIVLDEEKYNPESGEQIQNYPNYNHDTLRTRHENFQDLHTDSDEGVTAFNFGTHVDFSVLPFDHNAQTNYKTTTVSTDQKADYPVNPFRGDPVLNSADVYYRQKDSFDNIQI